MDFLQALSGVAKNLFNLLFLMVVKVQTLDDPLKPSVVKPRWRPVISRVSLSRPVEVNSQPSGNKPKQENRDYRQPDPPLLAVNRFHKNLPAQRRYRGLAPR